MAETIRKHSMENHELDLEKELGGCPFVSGRVRTIVKEFLQKEGITSLSQVDITIELEYRIFVAHKIELTSGQKAYYATALESCVLWYLKPFFQELAKEIDTYGKLPRADKNKVLYFLMQQGIHHLEEIDYSVRCRYEHYLSETGHSRVAAHVKVLDWLKLYEIQQKNQKHPWKPYHLSYQEGPVYLAYHPDYEIAQKFYYLRKKEEAFFDFSLSAAPTLKKQIFSMLNHVLEKECSRKLLRELSIVPLKKLYLFCVEYKIQDIERLEEREIEAFRRSMDGKVGTKTNIYMQIVDNTRKFLFLDAAKTNWNANVWYMERFRLKEDRMNPAAFIETLRFYEVQRKENRRFLQLYMKYCIGVGHRAIRSIRSEHYNICAFLRYCDHIERNIVDVDTQDMKDYIRMEEEREIQEITFNQKLVDLHRFFQFLVTKGYIERIPFSLEYYLKAEWPVHHNRSVPEETQMKLLAHLKYFPEPLRLMYLHLWSLGLRINEVCCIKGKSYLWKNEEAWIVVFQYKMKTEKMIPIPEVLYTLMEEYIRKNQISPDEFVFKNKKGGAYYADTFRAQMKRLCVKYEIDCGDYIFRTHDYRHTTGTKMYQNGVSIQAIRDYLGHKEEDMTKQYLDYIPEQIDTSNECYYKRNGSLGKQIKVKREKIENEA